MAGQEVGVAYVSLLPSGKGFGKAVEKDMGDAYGNAEKQGRGFFSRLGGLAKGFGLAVAGAVGVVGALAIKGGISRALNIEDAQAKLKGLGHDTKTVEAIMNDALASVKGTAFGLDTAATVAASAVAAGIKPGKELERYLRLTADAATIAGVSMEDMGSIINQVTSKGYAGMENLNRLTERGVPILQWLADEYGVTADELSKMVSRGEVDAATFRKVIEDNIGGAALASGDTTRGAFANMMASLSRFGELLVGPILSKAKDFFGEMIVVFDGLTDRARPAIDALQSRLDGISFEGLGEKVLSKLGPIVDGISDMIAAISTGTFDEWVEGFTSKYPALALFASVWETLAPLLPAIQGLLADIGPEILDMAPAFGDLVKAITPLVPALGDLIVKVLDALVEAAPSIVSLLGGVVSALASTLGSEEFQSFLDWLIDLIGWLGTPTTDAFADFADFLRDLPGIFGLMSGVMDGISDLFSGKSNIFEVVDAFFAGIGSIAAAVMQPFIDAYNGIVGFGLMIASFLSGLWAGISTAIADAWGGIGEMLSGFLLIIAAIFDGNFALVASTIYGFLSTAAGWWSATWNGAVSTVTGAWSSMVGAISSGIGTAIGLVQSLPGRVQSAIGDLGGYLLSSGRALIQGFIDGIGDMIGEVGSAVGGVIDFAASFFPHSPAKRGPLSGSGWQAILDSGLAIGAQFDLGLQGSRGPIGSTMDAIMSVPNVASSPAGVRGGNVYVEKIVAPDQDPRVSGRIMGREFARQIAG